MSRFRYITIGVFFDGWYYVPIDLAANWDDLSGQQRIDYLKETGVAAMRPVFSIDDELDFWEDCSPDDFYGWRIESESREEYASLELVAQHPKLILTLMGYYENKRGINFDEEKRFDPRIAAKLISPV